MKIEKYKISLILLFLSTSLLMFGFFQVFFIPLILLINRIIVIKKDYEIKEQLSKNKKVIFYSGIIVAYILSSSTLEKLFSGSIDQILYVVGWILQLICFYLMIIFPPKNIIEKTKVH